MRGQFVIAFSTSSFRNADIFHRYIIQLRYGCQSKSCTTSTCFSCRRRLAGNAPVRRYNATSARTLAIFLASQDNPERGLCRNPSVDLPFPPICKSAKLPRKTPLTTESKSVSNGHAFLSSVQNGTDDGSKTVRLFKASSSKEDDGNDAKTNNASIPEISKTQSVLVRSGLEERPVMDHRSFVQNVFGTVAFKMVEWLTPRNLELMARSGDRNPMRSAGDTANSIPLPPHTVENIPETKNDRKTAGQEIQPVLCAEPDVQENEPAKPLPSKTRSTRKSIPPTTGEVKATGLTDSKLSSSFSASHTTNSNLRRRTEAGDPPNPKGILSLSPKTEGTPDIRPLSRDILPTMPKKKSSRQNVITSPQSQASERSPTHEIKTSSDEGLPAPKSSVPRASLKEERPLDPKERPEVENKPETKASRTPTPVSIQDVTLPQSLSRLSIEIIDLVCDILQTDDTDEKHFLQPQRIYESLKRRQNNAIVLKRRPSPETSSGYPTSLRNQWHSFIQQGFFDVLCKPDSLLRSFSNDDMRLFDTQTIWYLMLRMTRVAPSLVLDSLWNVAGTLFLPPEKLEPISDWAKESQSQKAVSNKSVSNFEAAQVLNICLHALVAAVPLVTDARQLANMSRIRSYGLTMLGRDASSLEPASLCLQYEDAFSDELAMRLARRLFAAVPTRRRYGELLELHNLRNDGKREPDILDTVLASLKFLDLGTPSILNFQDSERDFHEKRVPTLILDWARTVMLQDWEGTAEVPSDGSLGGALAMIAAICKFTPTSSFGWH